MAVDLFAGAGGLSLGLEQAGFDVLCAVEYDPVHSATHAFNFPHASVLCADVRHVSADQIRDAAKNGAIGHGRPDWDGTIDLLAGGPPCQGFSLMGKRLIDDERNELVFHYFRLVEELQPRYFVMENVPGMASGGHRSILDELIKEFSEIGYRFAPGTPFQILNAADFGVPQDRKRLFLIGSREDQEVTAVAPRPSHERRPKRGAHEWLPLTTKPVTPSVWDAIGDLPSVDRYASLLKKDSVLLTDKAATNASSSRSDYARRLRAEADDPEDFSYSRDWNPKLLTSSMRTTHTEESVKRFSATPPGTTEPVSRFYRLDPSGLSNTLRAGSGTERGAFTSARPVHPTAPRVLTNREAARLHSFPDWFRLHVTKWHGFRQVGNAVAPLVGRAVGASIIAALGAEPTKPDVKYVLGNEGLLGMNMDAARSYFEADLAHIPRPRRRGASPVVDTTTDRRHEAS